MKVLPTSPQLEILRFYSPWSSTEPGLYHPRSKSTHLQDLWNPTAKILTGKASWLWF